MNQSFRYLLLIQLLSACRSARMAREISIALAIGLVSFSDCVWAQPPAPIEWGEARYFGIGHGGSSRNIALMGDTVVCVADSFSQGFTSMSCYSHDNGLTFSPWSLFDDQFWYMRRVLISGCNGRVFACCEAYDFYDSGVTGWALRSLDGGVTWAMNQPQVQGRSFLGWLVTGLQVVCLQNRRLTDETYVREVVISNDGGDIWQPPVFLDDINGNAVRYIAATQDHIIILGRGSGAPFPLVSVFTSDRTGQVWSGFQPIIEEPQASFIPLSIAGDTSSETAMVLITFDYGPDSLDELFVVRTIDGGITWKEPYALTDGQSIHLSYGFPEVFCRGRFWGVVWDNYWAEDPDDWGAYLSFSANHGKDWYPPSPIGVNVPFMHYSGGQFIGNEVRAYWSNAFSPLPIYDYATATGILMPDTWEPTVTVDLIAPDTIRVGDTLRFDAGALDEDTLSEVRIMLIDSAGMLPIMVLTRTGDALYQGTYVVPHEGIFQYRGEAEDFWENIGSDPETGWNAFATEGYSDVADLSGTLPISYGVSVYPNPSNGWPQVKLTPEWIAKGPTDVIIYNVLGQKIFQAKVTHENTSLQPDIPATSGLFFLQVSNVPYHYEQKILILK